MIQRDLTYLNSGGFSHSSIIIPINIFSIPSELEAIPVNPCLDSGGICFFITTDIFIPTLQSLQTLQTGCCLCRGLPTLQGLHRWASGVEEY